MKALLINPRYYAEEYYGKLAKLAFSFPPIGLLYIAAFVKENQYPVNVYDFQVDERNFDDFLREYNPDVVGITCQTALVKSTISLSQKIKNFKKDIIIIVGGSHPTHRPLDLLREPTIDIVVRGEGEMTFFGNFRIRSRA